MLELITEAMARRFAFTYFPGNPDVLECQEYRVVYGGGVYRLTDLVSPVTGQFNTPMEVMTFIQTNMIK